MREIKITPEEHDKLRTLEMACMRPSMTPLSSGAREGLFFSFDEERWIAGVTEILGDRTPPADREPTHLIVEGEPKQSPQDSTGKRMAGKVASRRHRP